MQLGRLEKVELREIWATEAQHFTPWLANEESLNILGQSLNMELELVAQETNVGPFRADLLCVNTDDGSRVLIENQLEKTDHTHLGQLLTYAAGLHSVNIVWIAAQFTEEHRAAVDWLNEITSSDFRFFALEVEALRIGNSAPAPNFNIVSQPNNWAKSINFSSKGLNLENIDGAKKIQFEFWKTFEAALQSTNSKLRSQKPRPQHWMNLGIGKSKTKLVGLLNTKENKIGVGFETYDDEDKVIFDALYLQRDQIENDLGFNPVWDRLDGKKATHIWLHRKADLRDENSWAEICNWMISNLERFDFAFRNRIKELKFN